MESLLLRAALDDLAVGCHRFEHRAKAAAYGRSRDAISRAVCALLVESPKGTETLVEHLEHTHAPRNLRSADRNRNEPENRNDNIGFRCVRGSGRQPAAPGALRPMRRAPGSPAGAHRAPPRARPFR